MSVAMGCPKQVKHHVIINIWRNTKIYKNINSVDYDSRSLAAICMYVIWNCVGAPAFNSNKVIATHVHLI